MQIPAAQRPASPYFRFVRSVSALMLREMTTTYGRSPGGYLWAVLEPLAGLVLLSIIFSYISRHPSLGTNFMYFFAGGLLPFTLYLSLSQVVSTSIRFSRGLLEYPAVSFFDAIIARFVLNALTQLLVMVLLFSGIILYYDLNPILNWTAIFTALAMAMAMAFGVGVVNCYLLTSYPLWERVWAILTRPLFFISGIFFIPENMPWGLREYLMWNPLVHVTSEMRNGLFSTYEAVHVRPLYVFGIALGLSVVGLIVLRRYHTEMVLK